MSLFQQGLRPCCRARPSLSAWELELEPELEWLPLPGIQCQGWPGSASGDSSGPGILLFLTLSSDL